MLRSLLIERFRLAVHTDHEEMGVFALVVAPGKVKIRESATGDTGSVQCQGGREQGRAVRTCTNMSMEIFVQELQRISPNYIDRLVVDQTAMQGRFDFRFWWTPQQLQEKDPGPTIFEALQRQLGLKLESRKLPVTTLVIDHIERLSAN